MTIIVRNTILTAGALLCLVLLCGFLGIAGVVFRPSGGAAPIDQAQAMALMELGALLVFAVGAAFSLRYFFRKTASSEMFFFIFFVVSLSLESFKALSVLLQVLDRAPYYGVILTRVAYFGRFFGVFCLLASGLFATGIDYQRFEIVLGIAALLAFTLSFSIPIDSSAFLPTLMYGSGGSIRLFDVFIALEAFAVLNFIFAAVVNRTRDYAIMGCGIAFVIVGADLLVYLPTVADAAIGFGLVIGGTVLFGNRTHAVYLWS